MSGGEAGGDDKQYAPSPRKLQKAREEGDIPRSAELTTTASYAGFTLAALIGGAGLLAAFGTALKVMLDQADHFARAFGQGDTAPMAGLIWGVLHSLLPLFLVPAGAALLALVAQRALAFTPENLRPKWSRLSPLANARQKFGPGGLFEFGKAAVKLFVITLILGLFLAAKSEEILGALMLAPVFSTGLLFRLLLEFLLIVLLISGAIGGVDYLWQYSRFLQRHMMTRQEMMDEFKEQEGDPHTKSARRQKGIDIATNRMIADVPKADVVIVNPEHYAVALKWERKARKAPVCLAKGVDEVAAMIREKAAEAGVPLHRDPPTARALHASVEVGQEIRPEQYRAVAAALRFAESLRARARARDRALGRRPGAGS